MENEIDDLVRSRAILRSRTHISWANGLNRIYNNNDNNNITSHCVLADTGWPNHTKVILNGPNDSLVLCFTQPHSQHQSIIIII